MRKNKIGKKPMNKRKYRKQVLDILNADYSAKPTYHEKDGDIVEKHLRKSALRDLISSMVKSKIKFEKHTIIAHVAETDAQKAVGLEVADALENKEGMLFTFDKPPKPTFHMGAVKFPIDILFLQQEPQGLRVAKIIHNVQPGNKDRWSCEKTMAVLETTEWLVFDHLTFIALSESEIQQIMTYINGNFEILEIIENDFRQISIYKCTRCKG